MTTSLRPRLLLVLAIGCGPAFAQPVPAERNATRAEIVGHWALLPLPDAVQPKLFQSNPWPAACQWFAYGQDGVLKSFDQRRGPCEGKTGTELSAAFAAAPAVQSWQYDLSPAVNKALVIVRRQDVAGYAEYWEPHYVLHSFNAGGAEIKEGDLLLYLINMQAKQIAWIRHLRKVD